MPGRDGTGPMGGGAMTGKGLEFCTDANAVKHQVGFGKGLDPGCACRCGFRGGFEKRFTVSPVSSNTQKDLSEEQKTLQMRLEVIEKQLENL